MFQTSSANCLEPVASEDDEDTGKLQVLVLMLRGVKRRGAAARSSSLTYTQADRRSLSLSLSLSRLLGVSWLLQRADVRHVVSSGTLFRAEAV